MMGQLAAPSGAEFAIWMGCLAAALVIANHGRKFFAGFRESPPVASTYATKQELYDLKREVSTKLESVQKDIGGLQHEMKVDKEDILEAGEKRTIAVHDRINLVLAAVSRLQGTVSQMRRDSRDEDGDNS